MKLRGLLMILCATVLTGCMAGRNYKRPAAPVPPQYRGATDPNPSDASLAAASLADTQWPELFQDDKLTELVTASLAQNYDLRIAAARVLVARAQLGITRADQFPTLTGNGQPTSSRTSAVGANRLVTRDTNTAVEFTQIGFGLAWELDVWGRLRRLTEAARAEYLASEEARRGVITTLISDVTGNYLSLRELDAELDIAQKTRAVAEAGLELTTLRLRQGVTTRLDVRQAEQFLYTTTRQIAAVTRQIEQTENLLSLLAARNPGDIARGKTLAELAAPASIPPGLPSSLLERRPDIRAAEQQLIAANARIGAARAAYFPQIGLTALFGAQSRALSDLFTGPARTWTFAPAATVPLFNAGRIRSTVQLTEAFQQESLATYERAIQNGFREVSDALIAHRQTVEERTQQQQLVQALQDTVELSTLRYRGGLDSYLQVLDAQRNLFQGQLLLAQLRRNELLAVVQLYRALGGGWR